MNGPSEIDVESVTMTIPPGQNTSNFIDLPPPLTRDWNQTGPSLCEEQETASVRLIPIEILIPRTDSRGDEIPDEFVHSDQLRVAKWELAFSGTEESNPEIDPEFNEFDVDRFYLRVNLPWRTSEGVVEATLETTIDAESPIELIETPADSGIFLSRALILVSNDGDDQFPEGTDELASDVTHKVRLGDQVAFTIPIPGDGEATATAKVSALGTLKLDVWRVNAENQEWNNETYSVRSVEAVNEAVESIKEAYAQVGLKIDATVTEIEWPASVSTLQVGGDWSGLSGFSTIVEEGPYLYHLTAEYKKFIDEVSDGTLEEVDLYFLMYAGGGGGISMTWASMFLLSGETDLRYVDHGFVNEAAFPRPDTPQHELLHILVPEEDHDGQEFYHLLSTSTTSGVFARKRISKNQQRLVLLHRSVQAQ